MTAVPSRLPLLALVATFIGLRNLRAAYAHAIEHDYRFYSYGDAMLIRRTLSVEQVLASVEPELARVEPELARVEPELGGRDGA